MAKAEAAIRRTRISLPGCIRRMFCGNQGDRDVGEQGSRELGKPGNPVLVNGMVAALHVNMGATCSAICFKSRALMLTASGVVCVVSSTLSPTWFCTVLINPQVCLRPGKQFPEQGGNGCFSIRSGYTQPALPGWMARQRNYG